MKEDWSVGLPKFIDLGINFSDLLNQWITELINHWSIVAKEMVPNKRQVYIHLLCYVFPIHGITL